MAAFEDLTPEGRMQKIVAHIETGHPVPSEWASWLVSQGFGKSVESDYVGGRAQIAFADLNEGERKARLLTEIAKGNPLSGNWVRWLLDQGPEAPASGPCGP